VNDWWIAATVGAVLVVLGALMMRSHLVAWRRDREDAALDDPDRKHLYTRFRRRMQTSGCIILIGILIVLGDSPIAARDPRVWTLIWCVVLVIVFLIILLALGDLTSTRVHSRVAMARLKQKQRALETQLKELQSRRSNGRPKAD
jgi:uncharacterized membrane protein